MKTHDALRKMFNTVPPMSMLDSGGAYGYVWQKNRRRCPSTKEPGTVHVEAVEEGTRLVPSAHIETVLFHHLLNCLRYDEETHEMTASLLRYWHTSDSWESIREWIANRGELVSGPDGFPEPISDNSFNWDTSHDQVFQFTNWSEDGWNEFVALQIHQGCDVRGGYTAPKVFRVEEGMAIHDDTHRIGDPEAETWDSDDGGYSWSPNRDHNLKVPSLFGDLPVEFRGIEEYDCVTQDCTGFGRNLDYYKGDGVVVLDPTGRAFGPVTGRPISFIW